MASVWLFRSWCNERFSHTKESLLCFYDLLIQKLEACLNCVILSSELLYKFDCLRNVFIYEQNLLLCEIFDWNGNNWLSLRLENLVLVLICVISYEDNHLSIWLNFLWDFFVIYKYRWTIFKPTTKRDVRWLIFTNF